LLRIRPHHLAGEPAEDATDDDGQNPAHGASSR
jgi:hypothetical protein